MMIDENDISPIQSDFERIKKRDAKGLEYWTSREPCNALGYSTYQKFNRTLTKAIAIANKKGCNTTEHFNPTFEMVKLNSGSFRKVENIHLSRGYKNYDTLFYNLDAVIAVGFRVSSYQASQFRMWTTSVLKGRLFRRTSERKGIR